MGLVHHESLHEHWLEIGRGSCIANRSTNIGWKLVGLCGATSGVTGVTGVTGSYTGPHILSIIVFSTMMINHRPYTPPVTPVTPVTPSQNKHKTRDSSFFEPVTPLLHPVTPPKCTGWYHPTNCVQSKGCEKSEQLWLSTELIWENRLKSQADT